MNQDVLATAIPLHVAANVWIGDQEITQILSVEITQRHGDHNRLRLRFYQDQVQQEGSLYYDGAEKLLGQVVEIILQNRLNDQEKRLENLFVVEKINFEHDALNEGILVVEGISPTGLIDNSPHFESFYRQNLASIVKTVAKPLESVKGELRIAPTLQEPLSFICRYGESGWDFLKRLSAETGQWLYFNGRALIFGEPEAVQSREVIYGYNCNRVSMNMQTKPVVAGYFDYDAAGNTLLQGKGNSDTQIAYTDRAHAFKKSTQLFGAQNYRYPVSLPVHADTLQAIGRQQAMVRAADMYVVSGESTVQELRVGMIVPLKMQRRGQQASHTPIRVTAITHRLDAAGHYSNSFEGINAQSPAPPQINYRHPQTGHIPAEVISNADPQGQGRVQVKFLGWQQAHSLQQTDWVRILTPDAGSSGAVSQNRGYVFIPEVGDQVMIGFEHNNPDRPYVIGSIFHGGNGAGGGADNHKKTISTRTGCLIQIDDAEGQGSVYIKDPSGNTWHMDGSGNISVEAPNDINITAGKNFNLNVGENMTTTVGMNSDETVGLNRSQSIGMNATQSVGAMKLTSVTGDASTFISGRLMEVIDGDVHSETKQGKTLINSEGGIETAVNGSITKNAQGNIDNRSGNIQKGH